MIFLLIIAGVLAYWIYFIFIQKPEKPNNNEEGRTIEEDYFINKAEERNNKK